MENELSLKNPYLTDNEYLYHLGMSTSDRFVERFQDVKFVCLGGKASRMQKFAYLVYDELDKPESCEFEDGCDQKNRKLRNLSEAAGRYSLYKVGHVISASHGIGAGSLSIVLHELLKLVYYAKCSDVKFIRIGTSGGLGIDPGTVVLTNRAYNGLLEPCFRQIACGIEYLYDTNTNVELGDQIEACAKDLKITIIRGNTMASDDFYEEQARLDGALCVFNEDDKKKFLDKAFKEHGILNMEMESSCFVATCNRAGVKSAVVCACVINRLLGDEITSDRSLLQQWESFPQKIVSEVVKRSMTK